MKACLALLVLLGCASLLSAGKSPEERRAAHVQDVERVITDLRTLLLDKQAEEKGTAKHDAKKKTSNKMTQKRGDDDGYNAENQKEDDYGELFDQMKEYQDKQEKKRHYVDYGTIFDNMKKYNEKQANKKRTQSKQQKKKKTLTTPPNILFILADDLGYNDIEYQKDSDAITPNLKDLANAGRILNYNYVYPICTPSRAQILTGRYANEIKIMHGALEEVTAMCTPPNLDMLPKALKTKNYKTYGFGKWHQGFCQEGCLPTSRGFDVFEGLYAGMGHYYNHTDMTMGYYDWHRGEGVGTEAPKKDVQNKYTTDVLKDLTVDVINKHDPAGDPFFIYMSHTAVHTPFEVPDKYLDMYPGIAEPDRKAYLAMMTALDDSVGAVLTALKDSGNYDNTLIVFSADNGGEVGASNNWPLRGVKCSLWEGGSRVLGFVAGNLIKNVPEVNDGLFNSVDWFPTFLSMAGGNPADYTLNGVDQSSMIIDGGASARTEVLLGMDFEPFALFGNVALRDDTYKLMWGFEGFGDGYGYGNVQYFWEVQENLDLVGGTRRRHTRSDYTFSDEVMELQAKIVMAKTANPNDLNSGTTHLFNLKDDPYEENDLAGVAEYADRITAMKNRVVELYADYRSPGTILKMEKEALAAMEDDYWMTGWCDNLDLNV